MTTEQDVRRVFAEMRQREQFEQLRLRTWERAVEQQKRHDQTARVLWVLGAALAVVAIWVCIWR